MNQLFVLRAFCFRNQNIPERDDIQEHEIQEEVCADCFEHTFTYVFIPLFDYSSLSAHPK